MCNSWSTSGQPNFVRALGRRKTVQNSPSKILYTELVKSWPTLGQLLANSPPHGKLQASSLQWSSGNTRELSGIILNPRLCNSWSTSGQPDFVRALSRRKTVPNSPSKILYTELVKSWPTLGQLLANSPTHGKLQASSLQWSSGNTQELSGIILNPRLP